MTRKERYRRFRMDVAMRAEKVESAAKKMPWGPALWRYEPTKWFFKGRLMILRATWLKGWDK